MFRKFLNPDNDLMILLSQITDVLFLSIFWLFTCIPVVTAGPGTAALYDAVYRGFRLGEKESWHRFFHAFRTNFKTGCLVMLPILLGGWLILRGMAGLFLSAAGGTGSWILFFAAGFMCLLLVGVVAVLFPLLSRFETGVGRLLGNALRLSMAHLPRTVALAVIHGLTIFACLRYVLPVLFLPAICMLVSSFLVEPMFRPYLPAEEEAESGEITREKI